MKSWKLRTTTSASCGTSFVDEVHATAGGAGDRALDVFDDVDEVFEIPGLAVDTASRPKRSEEMRR
ncbi:hypothetical protein ACF05W_30555 [Streptomyces lydicus]|uniref:hypothetical protein n=1 Tax=Streptomyces lydicus TaxID=47763 RepID=UPI0036F6FC6D